MTDPTDNWHDKEMALFHELSHAFYSVLDLEPLIQTVLEKMLDTLGAQSGSVWLFSESQDRLVCRFQSGLALLVGATLGAGEGISGWVAQTQTPLLINDVTADPRWASRIDAESQFTTRSLMSVPLMVRGQSLGVLNLSNKTDRSPFRQDELAMVEVLAGLAALAIHNVQLFERERRQREQQALLQRVGDLLHETLDLDRLLQRVFEQVPRILQAEAASVWLVDDQLGMVMCRLATGMAADQLQHMKVPLGQGVVGLAAATGQTVLIADAGKDPRVFRQVDQNTGFVTRSLLTVPLLRRGRCLGALQTVNKLTADGAFTPSDQELLERLADSAALAIENAQLFTDLESSYEGTLDALAGALDLRDHETQGHSRRVTEYTVELARQAGVNGDDMIQVRRGALLHDIGKIGVPDRVLLKPGPLDDEERAEMRRHPLLGYEMLVGIPFLTRAAEIVLAHQERYDGEGYPCRLKGEDIPLGARLFAVADTFDAITSDRPYRAGRPYEVAAAEIKKESGKQFDPLAVEIFQSVSPEKWQAIRSEVNELVEQRRLAMQSLARALVGEQK
ncbi:MAG: GAF domain-containing protein [Chloroflexi bacterium]|nr:GAF domain-containing protein [Chloroflexota bacterium]